MANYALIRSIIVFDLTKGLREDDYTPLVEMTCTPLAPLISIIYRGARTPSIHNEFKLDEPPHTPFNTPLLE
jgi:hypothetical protein